MSVTTDGPQRQAREPASPARPSAPSWLNIPAALGVAVVTSVTIQVFVSTLSIPQGSNVGLALTASAGLMLALVLIFAAFLGPRPIAAPLTWAGLSALSTTPLALFLAGTRHYVNGVSGDQGFRVEYLTRFADSARLADFAYADLPAYYPAGWFWVGGRLAHLLGVEPWAFYKPFAITTMAVTAVLVQLLWARLTSPTRALGLSVATVLAGFATLVVYSPYSWLTAALIAPTIVLGTSVVDAVGDGRRAPLGVIATVGLVLGVAAVTHTQIAIFGALTLGVVGLVGIVRTRGGVLRPLLRASAIVVAVALPFVLVFWTPFWLARLRGATGSSAAQRFLPEIAARYPMPMLESTGFGALALAGLVWIVVRATSDHVARGLAFTAACGYAWYLLSTLALVENTTLLSFRIEPIIAAALACGAVGAAADVVHFARERLPDLAPRIPALVAVVAAIVVVAQIQSTPETYKWAVARQYNDYYPNGLKPDGSRSGSEVGSFNGELAAGIDQLAGRPEGDIVILSASPALVTYHSYRTWTTLFEQFSNPLAGYNDRRRLLLAWAASKSPNELLAALDASPWRPPDVFVLERGQNRQLGFGFSSDRFPLEIPHQDWAVFDARLFDHPAFVRRDVGPYAVIVRRGA